MKKPAAAHEPLNNPVQLTAEDLRRIAKGHTPIVDWPEEDCEAMLHPSAFAGIDELVEGGK